MQSCPCHRNTISEPMPMLEGPRQLAELFTEIFVYLDDLGDDYLIERMNQAERLAEWAISQCRVCNEPPTWFGYGNEGSIIHVCTSHRATAGTGYTGCRLGDGWGSRGEGWVLTESGIPV